MSRLSRITRHSHHFLPPQISLSTRHSHHSLPPLSLSLATVNSLSLDRLFVNAESLSPEICLPNPEIDVVCRSWGLCHRWEWTSRLPEVVPTDVPACAAPAVGRRCSSPRWKQRSSALALCRRWLCSPRIHSPLFVATVERSSIVAASTLSAAGCAAPAAIHRSSSRRLGRLPPLAMQPRRRSPVFIAAVERSSSLPRKPSPSPSAAACTALAAGRHYVRRCLGNHRRWLGLSPPLLLPLRRFLREAKLQMRRQELTQTTPDQPVDDEAVYYKVAGECPKGHVYGLGSLGRKKRRYADDDCSRTIIIEYF
ncbi:hypothetical protein Scep_027871 [Stephania cephalantha]|uniref:Uncharacterized protein n=1 Tax=Stephania cephalantha TaxID=152367 RepID=A0AAP0E8U2_9MAGN